MDQTVVFPQFREEGEGMQIIEPVGVLRFPLKAYINTKFFSPANLKNFLSLRENCQYKEGD
jgi:hypothetical protein